MWSAISRLFAKTKPEEIVSGTEHRVYDSKSEPVADAAVHVFDAMDRNMGDDRRRGPGVGCDQQLGAGDSEHFSDAYDTRQVSAPLFLYDVQMSYLL